MDRLTKYQIASAEALKIHLVDLVHNASFLNNTPIHRNEIEFAAQHEFSGMSAAKTELLQSVQRAVNCIYENYDSLLDFSFMDELYFQIVINNPAERRNWSLRAGGSIKEDVHTIFQMKDPIGRADVMFAYIVECGLFPEYNNIVALMFANACLVNSGAGTMYAPTELVKDFAKLVLCTDHKAHRVELMEMLRQNCHTRIFSVF